MSNHQAYQMNSPPATDTKDIKAMIISMIFYFVSPVQTKIVEMYKQSTKSQFCPIALT